VWESPEDLAYSKAHTIFVVNALGFPDFLVELEVDDASLWQFDR